MQRYRIFFIIVNVLLVSGGFSAHHQELKNCTHSIWYVPGLLVSTASGSRPRQFAVCLGKTTLLITEFDVHVTVHR
jgi:hypothetical protein